MRSGTRLLGRHCRPVPTSPAPRASGRPGKKRGCQLSFLSLRLLALSAPSTLHKLATPRTPQAPFLSSYPYLRGTPSAPDACGSPPPVIHRTSRAAVSRGVAGEGSLSLPFSTFLALSCNPPHRTHPPGSPLPPPALTPAPGRLQSFG